MGKLTILVGISGSGKSTLAKSIWMEDPRNTIIISRDVLRYNFGYDESTIHLYYERSDVNKLEKEITFMQDSLIYDALTKGKHVIIDATNLKKKYIEEFAFWNVPTDFRIALTSYDLEECIKRDAHRVRKVGEDVIKRQYNQFMNLNLDDLTLSPITIKNNPKLKPVYIFDIDGTLAHSEGRNPFDFSRVGEDTKDELVGNLFSILSSINRDEIMVCTGREETCRDETELWFLSNFGFVPKMFMRKKGDYRADWIVKTEMWQDICKSKYILGMFDDRQQVVRRARMLGFKVIQVDNGCF